MAKPSGASLAELKRVLVPTDGSQASLEAVEFACALVRRTKGQVLVVHVIEVPRALPLDADMAERVQRGEEILAAAEGVADQADYRVEADLLQAREAAHAVVDEAAEQGADAIILGVEYHRPFGEFQLGSTTQYVLKNARCLVLVRRQPVPE